MTGRRIPGREMTPALRFTFDGVPYAGQAGDTLASALLANGVRTVARSAELGRPRGIFSAGVEEPNAYVRIGPEPMLPATRVELYDGLTAHSLNGRGCCIPAHHPPSTEAALMPNGESPPRSDKAYLHCDVLVVGGGPAGLAAAWAAGDARVVLLEQDPELGGDLLTSGLALPWLAETKAMLTERPEVRVLTRTTAIGLYDHNYVVAAERQPGHGGGRLWHIRAGQVVLATGACEMPIAFSDNDRPGIMLANAVRTYLRRYSVLPGRRAVVFTRTDSAYAAAIDLLDAGAEVAAIVDPRTGPCGAWADAAWQRGIPVLRGHEIFGTGADASGVLDEVLVAAGDDVRIIGCDLLAVSGGWEPAVQLFRQAQGTLRFDDRIHAFVPDLSRTRSAEAAQGSPADRLRVAGACRGVFGTAAAIADGYDGAVSAAYDAEPEEQSPGVPRVVPARDHHPQFVDLHRDITVADLEDAVAAGLTSAELIKRQTTAGTGIDQGKTAITGATLTELLRTVSPPSSELALTPTTFRPPYTPVPFAMLAGRDRGTLYDPVRVTAMHEWHVANGAVFEDVGQWKRPWYFPREDEDMDAAVQRECRAARTDVAAMDASTLGKIDIQGPDAADFLDRVYVGRFSNLAVGRCRYGVMCGPDGMVFDDGVSARLADDHYAMTTTTGNAAAVLDHLEEWLQTEWPSLRVRCTSVTDHWATVAVAGPRSPEVVAALGIDPDMPFMSWREAAVGGTAARVFRISFSGELAYEINVRAWYGLALWEAVMVLGVTPYGTETMHVLRAEKGYPIVGQETDGTVTPADLGFPIRKKDFIGKSALWRPDSARPDRERLTGLLPERVLPEGTQLAAHQPNVAPADAGPADAGPADARPAGAEPAGAEPAGAEPAGAVPADARPTDAGPSGAVPADARPTDAGPSGAEPAGAEPAGARLADGPGTRSGRSVGHVTSSYYSAALDRPIALALISGEHARVDAPLADRTVSAEVTSPVFVPDPEPRTAYPVPIDHPPLPRSSPLASFTGRLARTSGEATAQAREVPCLTMIDVRGDHAPRPAEGWDVLSLGPDWWLLVGPAGQSAEPDTPGGSSTDVSAQRTVLELSGTGVRDVLMTGCPLDLHPRAFGVGASASTLLGHAQVILHRRTNDSYRVFVRASFATYLADWLLDALR